jgi:hypothetical protein
MLMKIENKVGNIKWINALPSEVGSANSEYDQNGTLLLVADNYEMNTPYEFEMVLKDSLSKEHRYNVKGRYMEKTITRLY